MLEICDPNFGNLWSNINVELLLANGFCYGDTVNVRIIHEGTEVYHDMVPFAKSFG
jgi:S-adenosylmethionine hydrolase